MAERAVHCADMQVMYMHATRGRIHLGNSRHTGKLACGIRLSEHYVRTVGLDFHREDKRCGNCQRASEGRGETVENDQVDGGVEGHPSSTQDELPYDFGGSEEEEEEQIHIVSPGAEEASEHSDTERLTQLIKTQIGEPSISRVSAAGGALGRGPG